MNLSNINVDDIIANYPEMCKRLEVAERATSSRKRHENEWLLFFNYYKKGHKYIILEIYKIPKPKVDGRRNGNNSKYGKYTPSLLLDYLYLNSSFYCSDKSNVIDITNNRIILEIGLCNKNYGDKQFIENLYLTKTINRLDTMLFYQLISTKTKEIINSTFNNLIKNEKVILAEKVYMIYDEKAVRIATHDENTKIAEIKKLVLEELNAKNMFHLHVKNKQKMFYEMVSDNTIKLYGWSIAFETNLIALNELYDDFYTKKGQFILNVFNKIELKKQVNNFLIDYLHNSVENKFKNHDKWTVINTRGDSCGNYNDDLSNPEIYSEYAGGFYRLPCDYVEKQKLLTNLLIKL